ncbi:MAG: 30S ribosomal protein S2 [Anaerolinea sp.]|nr:30S ribosomal protein S2 [Anaerolinea sp.]MCC6973224.1 30S ribosomal protein S2 [Anaerolineae bacterium]CAG0985116.1 30S ribosomal protein S2 [Anaerolineae bacterium]
MSVVSMKQLLETGVHFGHRAKKWDPRMKPYIFGERNGIHIIDLQQTLSNLEEIYEMVRDTVSKSGTILFVGTKRQAQETIQQEAERAQMPYVNQRWLGGTLTNWRTIKSRIDQLRRFEEEAERGEMDMYTKKERLTRARMVEKLQVRLGGLRYMKRLPSMVFIIDVRREVTAVQESNALNIPIFAMVDTNCNPENIDYVIPANDDAIRAIKLITAKIADACLEGIAMRKAHGDFDDVETTAEESTEARRRYEEDDESAYLGPSTLAKLQRSTFGEDEE